MDLAALRAEAFKTHIGSLFGVEDTDPHALDLRLTAVNELAAQPDAPRRAPFSLEFTGPPPVLEQRIYRLQHAQFGELEIFLVPIGYDGDGAVLYEAVFN